MQLYFTTAGAALVKAAVLGGTPVVIDSFQIGEDNGFTPNPLATAPEPFAIYTGGASDMRKWVMANNDLAIQCLIDGTKGNFIFGNVMLFSGATAICGAIMRDINSKYQNAPGLLRMSNVFVLTIGLQSLTGLDLRTALDLSGMSDAYASAGDLADDTTITKAGLSRLSINRVQAHQVSKLPTLALKLGGQTPDAWTGLPLYSPTNFANNVLSGGTIGDGYVA